MRADIAPGGSFPDYELTDHTKTRRRLSGRKVQKDLDIKEYTDPRHDPMIPHTLVLKPAWSSTASTTATGSGAGRRSRTFAAIFAR
jgi:hypothetical protein